MNTKGKIVVFHPSQQHSFKLSQVLLQKKLLDRHFTTMFYNEKSLLYKFAGLFMSKDSKARMTNRFNCQLKDYITVLNPLLGLILLLVVRIDKKGKLNSLVRNIVVQKSGIKVSRYIKKNNIRTVVGYDNHSLSCFKNVPDQVVKILDMSSIPLQSIRNIIVNDYNRSGEFKKTYNKELNRLTKSTIKKSNSEIILANYFLVGSNFCKLKLVELGVQENKISVVPYGVDLSSFRIKTSYNIPEKVKFVFVGRLTASKGIHYLLEVVKEMKNPNLELILVGEKYNNEIYEPYQDFFTYAGLKRKEEMLEIYHNADVLIAPSLYEGMSLAVLEAMSCGLPVIVSKNTGYESIIRDEQEGFVVEVGNKDELRDKINWFIKNKNKIKQMGMKANILASRFTWDNYSKNLEDAIERIISEN